MPWLRRRDPDDRARALATEHRVELEALSEAERAQLGRSVIPMWNRALSHAVIHMWRACRRLGYDPDGLGGDHLAILASLFLGELADTIEPEPES